MEGNGWEVEVGNGSTKKGKLIEKKEREKTEKKGKLRRGILPKHNGKRRQ